MGIDEIDTVPAVDAVIGYLPEGDVPSYGAPPWDAYAVRLYDARAVHRPFTLERNGFELVHWPSAAGDFTDARQVRDVYATEVEDFVRARLGADGVAIVAAEQGGAGRNGAEPDEPAAGIAHVRLSEREATAQAALAYARRFPDGQGYRRAATVVCWRSITPPPQDRPLAICDFRSIAADDGVPVAGGGEGFRHQRTHRWYVYPDMTADEVLFFVEHDSDHARPWRAVRASVLDARASAAAPRRSLAVRAVAYFS